MEDLPSNSKMPNNEPPPDKERPKAEKVVTGKVIVRKKGLASKIANTFNGDDAESIMSFIFTEVAVPALQVMVFDMIREGAERAIFGQSMPRHTNSGWTNVNYNRASQQPNRNASTFRSSTGQHPDVTTLSRRARATHDFREVVLQNRREAEDVITMMYELIDNFGSVSVADFYDVLGVTSEYTDQRFGWNNIAGARVRAVRNGYVIDLPPTIELN